MKAWRALLVAEFRRAAGFLPWLVGLHGLTLGARTRWAWDISPQSLALLEWASWTVAGLVVGISLWQDAPLRRDRFLATRPHRLATLVTAKALALWGIAVLPFVVVECAALRWNGMAGEIVGLGTLQLAVWLTALLAAAFPLLWWWSTRRMAVAGLLTGVLALVLATLALSRLPGNRNIYSGTPWTVPVSPLSMLGTVGLFALGGCLLLPLLRARGGVLRGLAFSALVGLSLWGGLVMSLRQVPADEIVPASLVDLSVRWSGGTYGNYEQTNREVLPGRHSPERRLELAAEVLGIRHTWEVVADLPAKVGATASHADTQWRIVNLPKDTATGATDLETFMNRRYLSLEVAGARMWLGKSSEWRLNANCNDVLVVVDLTRGAVIRVTRAADGSESSGGSLWPFATSLRHQRELYAQRPDESSVDWDHEVRLIVMRPKVVRRKVVRRILHPWRSQGQVTLRVAAP